MFRIRRAERAHFSPRSLLPRPPSDADSSASPDPRRDADPNHPLTPPLETSAAVSAVVSAVPDRARRLKRHRKIREAQRHGGAPPHLRLPLQQHTYVQVIDDENQKTLCAIGTMSPG